MRVGFTGTHHGMSMAQVEQVRELIVDLVPEVFSHGDCVGADAQAHDIVRAVRGAKCRIDIYPSESRGMRAFKRGDFTAPAAPSLVRNMMIVRNSAVMIATPYEPDEQLRGGTWSTIRKARTRRVPIYIVLPSGVIIEEGF